MLRRPARADIADGRIAFEQAPRPRRQTISPGGSHERSDRTVRGPRRAQEDSGGVRADAPARPGEGASEGDADLPDDDEGPGGSARVAGVSRRDRCGDGVHGRVLAPGVGGAGGRLPAAAGQRAARQAGPGPQDGRAGLRVARAASRVRAAQGQLRAVVGDSRPARPDPSAQDAGAGAEFAGQPGEQDPGVGERQAGLGGVERHGGNGPGDPGRHGCRRKRPEGSGRPWRREACGASAGSLPRPCPG